MATVPLSLASNAFPGIGSVSSCARVELDGGEHSLSGGSGGSHGGDGGGSGGDAGVSDGRGHNLGSGVVDGGHDVSGGTYGQGSQETVVTSISQGKSGSDGKDLSGPPLPLGGGLLGDGGLGVNDFLGISDLGSLDSLEDGGGSLHTFEDGGSQTVDGKVGSLDTESVDVVRDVVDSLEDAVSINILVGTGGHSVGVTGLSLGGRTSSVSEGELSELILSVELMGGGGGGDC